MKRGEDMTRLPKEVRPYAGRKPRIDDPWMRISYETSRDMTRAYYAKPTDVDVAMMDGQVVLNEATAAFLYGGAGMTFANCRSGLPPPACHVADKNVCATIFTPTRMKTPRGRHPKLDAVVDVLLGRDPTLSDREKVLRLLSWCRDIAPRGRKTKLYHAGGPEELIAEQGGDMCNENSRVLIVLCQLAGFAARYVGHYSAFARDERLTWVDGHGSVEVYLEGGWAYFDIEGRHFTWPDGRLASLWDLVRNPDLYSHQPAEFRALLGHWYWGWNHRKGLLQPPHLQVIGNYDEASRRRFTFTPVVQTPAWLRRFERFAEARRQRARAELRELVK
jgi:hypothetical protein